MAINITTTATRTLIALCTSNILHNRPLSTHTLQKISKLWSNPYQNYTSPRPISFTSLRNLATNAFIQSGVMEDLPNKTNTNTPVGTEPESGNVAISINTQSTVEEEAVVHPEQVKDTSEDKTSSTSTLADAPPEEKKVYLRRKKIVLMLSYCGQTYLGMQKNPGTKTIEDDLLKALLKAGYIDEESLTTPRVMQFQRAARTDKHVSAARQIVSLKLPDHIEISTINTFLPPEIRVMGAKKVTKGFDCKSSCDARTYMYMIPTFAFTPMTTSVTEDYRISPEVLENLREILKVYLGTKNFHNFTSRRKPTDPSSRRYIISFTASDPFIKDGLEYLILRVKGQSFMLHQIRKMIGLVVAYLRGFAGLETFSKSWELARIDIPKAPGVGLVLDQVHYERYNKRYGGDGVHSTLTWDEVEEQVEAFCQSYIYPVITKFELEEKSMFTWLATLPYHTYDERTQNDRTENKDGDVVHTHKEISGIGKAATAAMEKGVEILGVKMDPEDSDEDDDDEDSDDKGIKKKKAKSRDKNDDEDDDDNEFVKAELAKRQRKAY